MSSAQPGNQIPAAAAHVPVSQALPSSLRLLAASASHDDVQVTGIIAFQGSMLAGIVESSEDFHGNCHLPRDMLSGSTLMIL